MKGTTVEHRIQQVVLVIVWGLGSNGTESTVSDRRQRGF